jgi:hypothetical protein
MRLLPFAIALGLAVAGCGPVIWDKPGVSQAEFSQEDAQCRLVARGMNSGEFYAEGSQSFVAGAAVGNAVGTAVATRATYKDCMMAKGYSEESQQAQANAVALKPISDNVTSCVAPLYASASAEPIRRHAPFKPADMTPSQGADPAFATPEEIAAIDGLLPPLRACQQAAVAATRTASPPAAPILEATYAAGEGDLSALKARSMTWGQFNTRRRERAEQMTQQLMAVLQRAS